MKMSKILNFLALFFVASASRGAKATDEQCIPILELFQVTDLTGSMREGDWDNLVSQMPPWLDHLKATFEFSSYGVGSFTDKPVSPLGDITYDYCLQVKVPITHGDYKTPVLNMMENVLYPGGGDDWKENQIGAMKRAALASKTNYTDTAIPDIDGNTLRIRGMILVTDSGTHVAPDVKNVAGFTWESNSVVTEALLNSAAGVDAKCNSTEYPTPEEVGDILRAKRIVPIGLIAGGAGFGYMGRYYVEADLLDSGYTRADSALTTYYKDIWTQMGFDSNLVFPLNPDKSDFYVAVTNAINQLVADTCIIQTTSTSTSTTTPPTTTSTTTPPCTTVECPTDCDEGSAYELSFVFDGNAVFKPDAADAVAVAKTVSYEDMRRSVASFSDKPIYPFGDDDDFCYRGYMKLLPDTRGFYPTNDTVKFPGEPLAADFGFEDFDAALEQYLTDVQSRPEGEGDDETSLFYGILNALGGLMGVSQLPYTNDGKDVRKIMIAFTNQKPHVYDETNGLPDIEPVKPLTVQQLTRETRGAVDVLTAREYCADNENYPSVQMISNALKWSMVPIYFLVTNDVFDYYTDLCSKLAVPCVAIAKTRRRNDKSLFTYYYAEGEDKASKREGTIAQIMEEMNAFITRWKFGKEGRRYTHSNLEGRRPADGQEGRRWMNLEGRADGLEGRRWMNLEGRRPADGQEGRRWMNLEGRRPADGQEGRRWM